MRYGLKDQTLEQIYSVLKTFPQIKKVVLYGSRAKGNYKEGSDIDLCLFGEEVTQSLVNQIDLALDDLFLPYSFDLSVYSHLTNQDLISHINRRGILFYEKK